MSGSRHHRQLAAAAAAVALVLGAAACTGSSGGASDNPNAKTTITFWHGWSAPNEVKAIQDNIDGLREGAPQHHRQGGRQHHRRQDQPGPPGGWPQGP